MSIKTLSTKYRLLFVLLILLGTACQEAVVPPPTWPTAVPPSSDPGSWAIGFSYEFPESFWPVGIHRYGFNIQCPDELQDSSFAGDWLTFEVNDSVVPQPGTVYMRVQGLSTFSFTPLYTQNNVIHPTQQTTAVVYLVGLSQEAATAVANECDALIAWDTAVPEPLTPGDPFQP